MSTQTATLIRGIVQVTIPVTDLARSAAFYRDLLGLTYIREFGDPAEVTGCAMADLDARYLVALRRRDTLRSGADADLRGEHPIIVEATSPAAAEEIRDRASALGIPSTSGTHADGTWIEFLDPDGIAIRVLHTPTLATTFFGVVFGPQGDPEFYDAPRLDATRP
jgi:catechol 2,3-dioxygenase-like lactoylglutathione lyase family enzyme